MNAPVADLIDGIPAVQLSLTNPARSIRLLRERHLDVLLDFGAWPRINAIYAALSGAITSGLGYAIWYTVLPSLKATSAASVQLSVPVLAATGGILLLGESITLRYIVASIAVLGGIFLVVIEKRRS